MNAPSGCFKVETACGASKESCPDHIQEVGRLPAESAGTGLRETDGKLTPYSIMWFVSVLDEILKQIKQLLYMKNK